MAGTGGPGGPKGQAVGLMKCVAKAAAGEGKIWVAFVGEDSYATHLLDLERAEYFVVDQTYESLFTKP